MNVQEIVRRWLEQNGLGGLYHPSDDCRCDLADLFAYCVMEPDCRPGYKVACDCDGDCGYHIVPEKPQEATDATTE